MLIHLLKPEFEELIQTKDWVSLKDVLTDVPYADIADLLLELDAAEAVVIFRLLKKSVAADVFSTLPSGKGLELLELFTRQQLSEVMSNLEPDEQVALMEELPGDITQKVLNSMKPDDQVQVKKLLGYPEDSIGRLMTPRYVRVKSEWTIERSMEHIRKYGDKAETLNVIYVVDDKEKLIDDLSLTQLIMGNPGDTIETIMDNTFESLSAYDHQEEAITMFSKYGRIALPVVDTDEVLLGIVTVDDVLDVVEEETTEDMQKMAGMDALDDYYSQTDIFEMVKKRVGWLIFLFAGQILTALTMSNFEETLQQVVLLAYFVPLLISSGGNSGAQAATLIIRALATGDIKFDGWRKVFSRELTSGLMLGLLLGILGFGTLVMWDVILGTPMGLAVFLKATVVAVSLLLIVLFGNIIGAMLPFLLTRFGLDPAVTSAPFVATIVDVTGIIIYFSIAILLLQNI